MSRLIKNIPDEWKVVELGDACHNNGEYGINAAAVEYSDDLPTYLRITDINEGGNFLNLGKKSVSDPNYEKFILDKGDIVFARTGATVGKTYLYDEKDGELVFAGFLIRFKPKHKVLDSYFLKLFTSTNIYWNWVKLMSMRSGQPGINAQEYSSLRIPLPPFPEQQKIASILSKWDELIETQTQLIEEKEKQKKGLMQKLLTGKVRFPGFEEEWEYKLLEDVLDYEQPTKYIVKSTNYSDNYSTPVLTAGKTFLLGYTNETKGVYKDCLPVIIFDDFTTANKFVDFQFKVKSSAMKILKAKSEEYNIYFIYEMFQILEFLPSDHKRYWISEYSQLEIPVPDIKEQLMISEFASRLKLEIQFLKDKLDSIKLQKKGLMQQLLTGKIRVKI
jgi:type I restriction enzyme S subunit